MTERPDNNPDIDGGIFSPLKTAAFRRIWAGGAISSTGGQIQAATAAWVMTSISTAGDVALVQTASYLPLALLALPAGALADSYDKRKIQLLALSFALLAATAMMFASWAGLMTPWLLLTFCFLVGIGEAIAAPARGASIAELVPGVELARAVALHNISYNLARSVGPAVGGLVVVVLGATTAFVINVFAYFPLLESLRRWRRKPENNRLPPEGFGRSILAGARYVHNTRPVKRSILRIFIASFLCSSLQALLPMVAKDLPAGNAADYGLMLGFFGAGAVSGIFFLQSLRALMGNENVFRICNLAIALSLVVVSWSHSLGINLAILFIAGLAWMMIMTLVSISVQLHVPRWVIGRAIGVNTAAIALGVACGSWMWGEIASRTSLVEAYQISAVTIIASIVLGRFLPIPDRDVSTDPDERILRDPEIKLNITGRSGPVRIEIQYRIPEDSARGFYNLMHQMRRVRNRGGAYDWSLSQDTADPKAWSEFFRCPTWNDYLRLRERSTMEDGQLFDTARAMHMGIEPIKVKRWLDRPSGSVRWREDAPDRGESSLNIS